MITLHERAQLGAELLKQAKIRLRLILVAVSTGFFVIGCSVIGAPEYSVPPEARAAGLGQICDAPGLVGRKIAPIIGRISECGIEDPVEVHEVSGIKLSTPAKIDCITAKTLNDWTQNAVIPTFDGYSGGVREFHIVSHYSCRTRNNRPGARISEHAKGRAIDIAAFRMHNGDNITLLHDWHNGTAGNILHSLHKQACGPFGTVLGPDANAAHKDHFHFDTARYRAGAYCR